MVDGVGGLVFFDVGDGVGALEGGGRLGDCGIVVEAAECLYATSVGDADVNVSLHCFLLLVAGAVQCHELYPLATLCGFSD